MKKTMGCFCVIFCVFAILIVSSHMANAQPMWTDPEWTTAKMDAQNSSWVRTDNSISLASMSKPGFVFLWKQKLNNRQRELNALSGVVMVNSAMGLTGHKSLAIIGGTNALFAIDYDLGVPYWEKHFNVVGGTAECPTGITATPGRPTPLTPAPARGVGLTAPFRSGVGNPDEGVPTYLAIGQSFPTQLPVSPPLRPPTVAKGGSDSSSVLGSQRASVPSVASRPSQAIYTVSTDGILHTISQSSSKEVEKPIQFVPAGSSLSDLIQVSNVVYAATIEGCGNSQNSVFAVDLSRTDKTVLSWKATTGNILGAPAFTSTGTLYVSAGKSLVALAPKTLKVAGEFIESNVNFTSPPVIFSFKNHEMVAAGASDGRILIFDTAQSNSNQTVAFAASTAKAGFVPTALASWDDATGAHWLLAADQTKERSSIEAFRLVTNGETSALEPGWTSEIQTSPATPLVVNGVVFTVATGEFRGGADTATRIRRSTPAVLYALDGMTGKELWNSGKTITSFVHSSGLAASPGQVYVGTYDNTLYAFGFSVPRQ